MMKTEHKQKEHTNWYHMLGGWYRLLDGLGRLLTFGFCKPDLTFQHCLRVAHDEYVAASRHAEDCDFWEDIGDTRVCTCGAGLTEEDE